MRSLTVAHILFCASAQSNLYESGNLHKHVSNISTSIPVKVFVAIPTRDNIGDKDSRNVIRATWGNHPAFAEGLICMRFFCESAISGEDDDVVVIEIPESLMTSGTDTHSLIVNKAAPHKKFAGTAYWIDLIIELMKWGAANIVGMTHWLRIDVDSFLCPGHIIHVLSNSTHVINNKGNLGNGGLVLTDGQCRRWNKFKQCCSFDEAFTLMSSNVVKMIVESYPSTRRRFAKSEFKGTFGLTLPILLRESGNHSVTWWSDGGKYGIEDERHISILHSPPSAMESLRVKSLLNTKMEVDICARVMFAHPIKTVFGIQRLFNRSPSSSTTGVKWKSMHYWEGTWNRRLCVD